MSAFFGARAPELVPEYVNDLNIKPANTMRKMPLHERSISDLNKANGGKPTIRLVNSTSENDSSNIYGKNALPTKPSHILKPARTKDAIYVDIPSATSRPVSHDGYTAVAHRPPQPLKKANRFSASTLYSNADTLVADSVFSPTSGHFSFEQQKGVGMDGVAEHLEPLPEQSSDYPMPFTSDAPDIPELSSVPDRPRHMAHSSSCYSTGPWDDARPPTPPRRNRPRSSSSGLGFLASPISEGPESGYFGPGEKGSQESMAESAAADSTQERGTPHIIRYVNSSESIRPQFASVRPAPHHARSISSLWSTESLNHGNVAPLHIPRKRGHVHSNSLNSHPSLSRLGAGNLPTILSSAEAAPSSWTSQQDSELPGQVWPRRRRTMTSSSYSASVASPKLEQMIKPSSSFATISSELHSSDSAVPEPLFSSSAPLPQKPFDPSSNHFSTELDDTICELQAPPLREKRSGYIMKKRSNTEMRPGSKQSNHSTGETDRWSLSSAVIPQWAKLFYAGKNAFMSANSSRVTLAGVPYAHPAEGSRSRITLAGPPYSMINASTRSLEFQRPQLRHQHSRTETIDTVLTRPESSHSNWETVYSESPAPSRLAGSIFRSRGRPRSQTDIRAVSPDRSSRSPVRHRKSLSVFSGPSSPEIPEIEPIPLAPRQSFRQSIHQSLRQSIYQSKRISIRNPITVTPSAKKVRVVSTAHEISTTSHAQATTPWLRSYTSIPHLVQNARLARTLTAWRIPSVDEPFPAEMFGRGNRQIVCFCLGFLFPPLWMLAAILPLPHCGWRQDQQDAENGTSEKARPSTAVGQNVEVDAQWSWEDERKFLKARWWRTLNRVMSVVGVGILAAIITLAVLASRG